jgi:hypothetical protein
MMDVRINFLQVGKFSKEWGRGFSLFHQNMAHNNGTTTANVLYHNDSRALNRKFSPVIWHMDYAPRFGGQYQSSSK